MDPRRDTLLTPREMADWYNTGTVLVCASAAEGTPNPALEAAACGCTLVSTATGNMPELIQDGVNGFLVERRLSALIEGVEAACARYSEVATRMQETIGRWGWSERAAPHFDAFRRLLSGPPKVDPLPDLSSQVTVFVTTVGAPSYGECLARLCRQDCRVRIAIIERLAPLSAALQRMRDTCRTPYFIQVDEDMLLYPHAVRTLYERIRSGGTRVAVAVGNLYDPHLERCISGVKIFRHAVVRRHRVEGVADWVGALRRALARDGYRIEATPLSGATQHSDGTLGVHGPHWTPASIYERYLGLGRSLGAGSPALAWFEPYPELFARRFLSHGSVLDYYALMGSLAGQKLAGGGDTREKDYRLYDRLPGFDAARRLLAGLPGGQAGR